MNMVVEKSLSRDYAFGLLYYIGKDDFDCLTTGPKSSLRFQRTFKNCLSTFEEFYTISDDEDLNNILNHQERKQGVSLFERTLDNYQTIRELIKSKLLKRKFENLDKIVSTLLLLGATELIYPKSDPVKIINEYVLMAKKYGPKDSFTFINGVLDAIYKSR